MLTDDDAERIAPPLRNDSPHIRSAAVPASLARCHNAGGSRRLSGAPCR